jgi:WD40 repeat protein
VRFLQSIDTFLLRPLGIIRLAFGIYSMQFPMERASRAIPIGYCPSARNVAPSVMLMTNHTNAALQVNDCTFSPDGTQLASVSEDKRLIVWDCHAPSRTTATTTATPTPTPTTAAAMTIEPKARLSGHEQGVCGTTRSVLGCVCLTHVAIDYELLLVLGCAPNPHCF